ncbi:SMP-30/gluconolactonase/LRE family protein [Gilvimarinus agarilyticus]|uniref:SMP-30/gluconolactonase/LRE family protein n=1 Tax=Gilvimarinus agarilyticus TaxID=679259 RepID=UPI000A040443|nr:SMP-30/gluconolactonase/LRE family protein [Gilvimarinus agarilyticus]
MNKITTLKLLALVLVLVLVLVTQTQTACTATPPATGTEDWLPEHSFTSGVEGPAVDSAGNIYAVNLERQGTIGVMSEKNSAEVFISLNGDSIGNAIRFNAAGDMFIADYVNHNILKVSAIDNSVSVFAHDASMNQPNDIVLADSGVIYASDPNWADSTGQLWRIGTDGTAQLLEAGMGTTNGIELSPDGRVLYVNESVQRNVWRYDVSPEGDVTNKQLFYSFADFGMDGMSVDVAGNLYIARYGAGEVAVLSPSGELLRTIPLTGQHPTNIAFGGHDGKRAFVTMQKRGTIESFVNDVPGSDWEKMHRQ